MVLHNWQRLRSEILEPLSKGHKHVYRAYDWTRNTLGAWQRLKPSRVVIVEGCYAARPELKDYTGLSFWLKPLKNFAPSGKQNVLMQVQPG